MQINVTIQTFKTENELELSVMRWDKIKNEFMPRFQQMGLTRYTICKISNEQNKFQLSHIFEYKQFSDMIESGKIRVGPAILLGLWLSKNRNRLIKKYSNWLS